jgi:hypothetical protein
MNNSDEDFEFPLRNRWSRRSSRHSALLDLRLVTHYSVDQVGSEHDEATVDFLAEHVCIARASEE